MTTALNKLYTNKQIQILNQAYTTDFFMMINHGAKRSGKTVINNDLFINELRHVKKMTQGKVKVPQYICAGTSIGAFQRNVLDELNNKYDLEIKLDKFNSFRLFGVKVTVFGHEKISDLNKIRGMTSYGAYINEGSKANKEVFDEIVSRCSGGKARILCDTNPDNPNHWLKKNYIDKADGVKIIENHFTLLDNTFLTDRYVKNIIFTTPSGVFTKRNIYGEWCTAEGIIYEDFDESKHIIKKEDFEKIEIVRYLSGQDWGYADTHPGSNLVIAEATNGNYYVCNEINQSKRHISWWVTKVIELDKKFKNKLIQQNIKIKEKILNKILNIEERQTIADNTDNMYVYCDSARPEHVEEFGYNGLWAENADKSVESGIELVAKLFKNNKLFIVEGAAPKLIDNIYNYVYDEKTGKPVKNNDDSADALRYGLYTPLKEKFSEEYWREENNVA